MSQCAQKQPLTFLVYLLTYLFFGLLKTSITAFLQKYKHFFCNDIFFLTVTFFSCETISRISAEESQVIRWTSTTT